jgi:flavin prenyltransferase
MSSTDIVVAFTGASGSVYGVRLVEVLLRAGRRVHLTISPAAVEVFEREIGRSLQLGEAEFDALTLLGNAAIGLDLTQLLYHHFRNFRSSIASGSSLTGGMIICPCSMGTLASIANGISDNLIHRAADVHLKERRKLILVPRETPLGLIPLRNMVSITESGGIILPAMPAFYSLPQTVSEMVDFVVGRVCDQFGIEHGLVQRWGSGEITDFEGQGARGKGQE